jgi:hypothetical protein
LHENSLQIAIYGNQLFAEDG